MADSTLYHMFSLSNRVTNSPFVFKKLYRQEAKYPSYVLKLLYDFTKSHFTFNMALQKVLFDPRKPTDIRKTSAMDFAVRRTGKPNKISFNSLTNYFHTI